MLEAIPKKNEKKKKEKKKKGPEWIYLYLSPFKIQGNGTCTSMLIPIFKCL